MIRIIKSKTYNGMKDQINRLTKQILKQQNELSSIKNNSAVKNTIIAEMEEQIYNLKKDNKNLKSLLTKKKIDYKHLYKKLGDK